MVSDTLPGATPSRRILGLTSWFHCGLGITIAQFVQIFSYHLQTRLNSGGLIDAWRRLALVLLEWSEQIAEEVKTSAILRVDETGWRVNG